MGEALIDPDSNNINVNNNVCNSPLQVEEVIIEQDPILDVNNYILYFFHSHLFSHFFLYFIFVFYLKICAQF